MSFVYLFSIYSDLFCTSTLSKGKEPQDMSTINILDYHRRKINLLVVKLFPTFKPIYIS